MSTNNKIDRRDFIKVTGTAAAAAVTAVTAGSTMGVASECQPARIETNTGELVPGMRKQAEGLRLYVESDYAPLKACAVGNPSAIWFPDPDTWEMKNLLGHAGKELNDYLRKHKGKNMKDVDPKRYDECARESDALADALRKAGVKILRADVTPREILEFNTHWSGARYISPYGQAGWEAFGHVLVATTEVTTGYQGEFVFREALVEIMKNDPEAVWLSFPTPYPTADRRMPGPTLSPGDPKIFNKMALVGIGVPDPSHVKDLSKPRVSGDEFGAEILRRMLKPYGWSVETVYFDSKIAYHIDCILAPLEEGLMAMPKNALWTPLPKQLQDWEVMDVTMHDVDLGALNNEPLGHKRILLTEGTERLARDLEKRGWTCIEVPYKTLYTTFGSGLHCSTAPIWRES